MKKKSKDKSKKNKSRTFLFSLILIISILAFLVFVLMNSEEPSSLKEGKISTSSQQREKQTGPELLKESLVSNFNTANKKFKKVKVREYGVAGSPKKKYYNFEIITERPSQEVEKTRIRVLDLESPSGSFIFEDNLKKISTTKDKVYYQVNWEPEIDLEAEDSPVVWIFYITEAGQKEEIFFGIPENTCS